MSGRIIPLHGDLHDQASALLPWYVTGRLDADDRARVDAHLKTCAQCQADLAAERRLHAALADLPEDAVEDAEDGWAALLPRINARSPRRSLAGHAHRLGRQWRNSAPWLRWAVAAQFGVLALGGAALWQVARTPQPAAGQYHALGSAPAPRRPISSSSSARTSANATCARPCVTAMRGWSTGPTAADAYLLHVAAKDRDAAVEQLRKTTTIVLAEPVDGVDSSGVAP
ncbi:MAG: zf-HC2 domain-containing protein [Asticcacaulis sp.]